MIEKRNGKKFEDKWHKPANGMKFHNHIKVACGFDPETFKQIRLRAIKEKTSVAEQIRKLVEWGLEA